MADSRGIAWVVAAALMVAGAGVALTSDVLWWLSVLFFVPFLFLVIERAQRKGFGADAHGDDSEGPSRPP